MFKLSVDSVSTTSKAMSNASSGPSQSRDTIAHKSVSRKLQTLCDAYLELVLAKNYRITSITK